MFVGYGIFALHLPHVHDLKSKRRILRGLVDRIHARHRVSVAETGAHDLHQRAEISVAVVAGDEVEVERILERVLEVVDSEIEATILSWNSNVIEEEP
jgi:uncharacterized protein YlxP (DUF503 family)